MDRRSGRVRGRGSPLPRALVQSVVAAVALVAAVRPAAAHVDYVTDPVADSRAAIEFLVETLADPVNAVLVGGTTAVVLVGVGAYLAARPAVPDLAVLRETLRSYGDLVPWMLRLSVGLPLVGAGFQGYLFAPTVGFEPGRNPLVRLWLIGIGFLLLFGLATRAMAALGLLTYASVVATRPAAIIAFEYVPAFLALVVLGGGRPSADDMLASVAGTAGTAYGRIDPVLPVESRIADAVAPYRAFVPTVLRIGVGLTFVYLGLVEKLGDPARSLAVVAKYDLTAVVPVAPELWVLGAALAEIGVGLALLVGVLTRASAATAFLLFTTTLFGLPDDPVLAHVALFGLVSAIFTLGAGPLSVDALLAAEDAPRSAVAEPGD